MKDIDNNVTVLQMKIYVCLINYGNPRYPRTANQVSRLLGVPKSTISDAIKKLLRLEYISLDSDGRSDKIYRKGNRHPIMEEKIKVNYLEEGEWFDKNGVAIRPKINTELQDVPTFRAHLNGGWLKFTVSKEGNIDRIKVPVEEKKLTQEQKESFERSISNKPMIERSLFGNSKPVEIRGSKSYYGIFLLDDYFFQIRYQISNNGGKWFYVEAPSKIIVANEIDENTTPEKLFVDRIRPLLRYLEKWGNWRFKIDSTGDYEVNVRVRTTECKTKIEYGLDSKTSDILTSALGEDFGIIGESELWKDKSPDSQGSNGEFETNNPKMVHAINDLPITTGKVNNIEIFNIEIQKQIMILQQRVQELIECDQKLAEEMIKERISKREGAYP